MLQALYFHFHFPLNESNLVHSHPKIHTKRLGGGGVRGGRGSGSERSTQGEFGLNEANREI